MERNIPVALKMHKASKELEICYDKGESYRLSSEFLRVNSPSAEVRGHGNPVLQTGKINVMVTALEAVGNYAVRLRFDDGHDTGIYDWRYLYDLCVNRDKYWDEYLQALHDASASRDPELSVLTLF
ncbi:hypothetical protein CI610_02200 [invertebrate metagenome]|uniref:Gamma-butyrobetaine hydroxylase-like N-terminal domain-containing protein n=1 Tax=invertebrate metagenome TaxID=1711999 RepID=A0A2H9T6J1_9ZZZZ